MKCILPTLFLLVFLGSHAQVNKAELREDFNEIITDIEENYAYLEDKGIDLDCIRTHYAERIGQVETEEEAVLFFEYLLDEFYDSHIMLTTNRSSSFRLYSPIYATMKDGKAIITSIWLSQIEPLRHDIIGAEVLKINGVELNKAIGQFPTLCQDKSDQEVREWIVKRLMAGRYNEPRVLTLKLTNGKLLIFDMDEVKVKETTELLTVKKLSGIGIIRVNNSLGENALISAFDAAMDTLLDTKGLIIDLRNTVDGGNTYAAKGIMGRFIAEPQPYQKHEQAEQYDDQPTVMRSWVEYVTPRGEQYKQPVIVLVGRWTGSMGEGMAIGFDGMGRAIVVGTEMERLAGEVGGFSFVHQTYGYQLSFAKLFHVNDTPRELYLPGHYVEQTTSSQDRTMAAGLLMIQKEVTPTPKR